MTTGGKKMTSRRRLLDVVLSYSLFLCCLTPTSDSRRQAGRLQVCVHTMCVRVRPCTADIFGSFISQDGALRAAKLPLRPELNDKGMQSDGRFVVVVLEKAVLQGWEG